MAQFTFLPHFLGQHEQPLSGLPSVLISLAQIFAALSTLLNSRMNLFDKQYMKTFFVFNTDINIRSYVITVAVPNLI
jgi:hypothetical protein